MVEENKTQKAEKPIEKVEEVKEEKKIEETVKEEKKSEKPEEKKAEKKEEGKEKKPEERKAERVEKKTEVKIEKKDEARVNGRDLRISTKHAIALCKFIKGKKIDEAFRELEQVLKKEMSVAMKGEIPHRKGKGIMSGRYPIKACGVFIKLLKSLAANCSINGLEDAYITFAKADVASQPYRRFGSRRFKRSHVLLIAKEVKKKVEKVEEVKEKEKVKEKTEKKEDKREEKKEIKEKKLEKVGK